MDKAKSIGILFIDGWADWEFGFLSGAMGEWFNGRIVSISPDGKPVRSQGGLILQTERNADPAANADLDALAVIGSERWAGLPPLTSGPC